MGIPFDLNKYEMEKFEYEWKRFNELHEKYKDNVKEILEFARLWRLFSSYSYNRDKQYKD